ncbi:MAG: NAD(P)H-binding protein [Bacteriodetes bacterium]|nr:NAD(P)H-binding protein [Bacteroidota bacterium]
MAKIFVTGGSGYIGTRIIAKLLERGHAVTALVRNGSQAKLPQQCTPCIADVLDASTYTTAMSGHDVLVHLVGVAHPSPAKEKEFRTIDLASVEQAIPVAKNCNVPYAVYLSVAQPAPIMKPYWQARARAEEIIRTHITRRTFIRPWYVLGPGHWWPVILKPIYAFWKLIPSTRETALRLDLVTINQILLTLIHAIENPPEHERIIEAQEIKQY